MNRKSITMLALLTAFVSCSKQELPTKDAPVPEASNVSATGSSISISREDYFKLKDAISENDSTRIDSLMSIFKSSASARVASAGLTSPTILNEAAEYVSSYGNGTDYSYNPVTNWNNYWELTDYDGTKKNVYTGIVNMKGLFPARNNTLYVKFPFCYYERGGAFKGTTQITSNAWTEPKVWVVGAKLGDFLSGFIMSWNIESVPRGYPNPTRGNVTASILETRTVAVATNGSIKLMSSVNGKVVEVGAEIEAGFTVERKYNSTTTYDITGTFTITVNEFPTLPTINYNMGGTSYGIQIN